MKNKLVFLSLLILYNIKAYAIESKCTYPFEYKVNTDRLYPIMVTSVTNKTSDFFEILLKSPDDEYITLSKKLPTGCIKSDFCLKNIQSNKSFDRYRFIYESNQGGLQIKVYRFDTEMIAFILNSKRKYLGSVVLTNITYKKAKIILRSLQSNNHLCTFSEYENTYNKLGSLDIDKKLRLLYSMVLISPPNRLNSIRQNIVELLNKKKEVTIDLPLVNIKEYR